MHNYRQVITYHPLLGHQYVSNIHVRMRYGNDAYFLKTDELGFRNERDLKKGKLTILLLGDSYAAGESLANADRFGDMLMDQYDCKVINLAVNGYGADQQLLTYKEYKDKIPHDLVLWVPHMDDLYRNTLSHREGVNRKGEAIGIAKPVFSLDGERLVLSNVPVPRNQEKLAPESEVSTSTRSLPFADLKNKAKHGLNRMLGKHTFGKLSYQELNQEGSQEWQLMNRIIQEMKKEVGDKPLCIAPIPYNYTTASNEPYYYLPFFENHQDHQFQVIDLHPNLREGFQAVDNEGMYLPLCGHFTPFAHQIVTTTLADSLGLEKRTTRYKTPDQPASSYVLGISCFYHDSAAALLKDGVIIAAAQEERFTRKKHDPGFPVNAIHYCLEEAKIHINELKAVCYYDNLPMTVERVIHNVDALQESEKEGFWEMASKSMMAKAQLPKLLASHFSYQGEVFCSEHHISHAASAFYPSAYEEAAILIVDGVGEWACSTIAHGVGNEIKLLKQQNYPHSLGLLYSAFTYFCGFKVNSGEYKLMGLAPYGKPTYVEQIKKYLLSMNDDGSIALNLDYFGFMSGGSMSNDQWDDIFDGPRRKGESPITQREMDLAASVQKVTEEVLMNMVKYAHELTHSSNLVLAGGVALNCVANGELLRKGPYKNIWIQPAAGDAGGALGAALDFYYQMNEVRDTNSSTQTHAYYGPSFSREEIEAFMNTHDATFHQFPQDERETLIADWMTRDEKIIGYFDGRMEFGPRALGNRSIMADPTNPKMQSKLNLKIKYRESFRPFAPLALEENLQDYFDIDSPSPFMLMVAPVREHLRKPPSEQKGEDLIKIVNEIRSDLPSITHVDYSARLQSMNATDNNNPRVHRLLEQMKAKTGFGVVVNTSFNVRGEPIVCTPEDAYRCFMRTEMDVLVLGDYYLIKSEQPNWEDSEQWEEIFELD